MGIFSGPVHVDWNFQFVGNILFGILGNYMGMLSFTYQKLLAPGTLEELEHTRGFLSMFIFGIESRLATVPLSFNDLCYSK